MKAAKLVFLTALVLSGCVSVAWRPVSESHYSCADTGDTFSVRYSWDPPVARVTMGEGAEPLDLPMLPRGESEPPEYYTFGDDNVRLMVRPRYAFLDRRGQLLLTCDEEVAIVI